MKTSRHHRLGHTSEPGGLLFECDEGCGRRLVLDRVTGRLTVIDRGDPYALHRVLLGDVETFAPRVSPA